MAERSPTSVVRAQPWSPSDCMQVPLPICTHISTLSAAAPSHAAQSATLSSEPSPVGRYPAAS